ncbi:hypothetical protein NADFUDRAFT_84063, partial [Nadsonia fulvescens var. elongata DSM 6958]
MPLSSSPSASPAEPYFNKRFSIDPPQKTSSSTLSKLLNKHTGISGAGAAGEPVAYRPDGLPSSFRSSTPPSSGPSYQPEPPASSYSVRKPSYLDNYYTRDTFDDDHTHAHDGDDDNDSSDVDQGEIIEFSAKSSNGRPSGNWNDSDHLTTPRPFENIDQIPSSSFTAVNPISQLPGANNISNNRFSSPSISSSLNSNNNNIVTNDTP